jgi:spermidine/putrescine transport system substrate-binding protein
MNRRPALPLVHGPYSPWTLTRRRLLTGGSAAVVGAGLLAACGGDSDGDAAQGTVSPVGDRSPATSGASAAAAGGALNYLSWEGYDLPIESMDAWREANGVTVNATYIANSDETQAKIAAGGESAGYDLITYYQGYKNLYAELGILAPLDPDKIPNLAGQNAFWLSDLNNYWLEADGTVTGVPWTWTALGLTYNSAEVDGFTSWEELLDPTYTGRIGVIDDPQGQLAVACQVLGLDPAAIPKDRSQEIVDWISQFVAQAPSIAPSYGDMTSQLVSGEIVATYYGWAAMNSFAADAGLSTVTTTIPDEGSFTSCDAYAIPPTAQNPDLAHAWINQALDPQVNAEAAEYLQGGVTVDASLELLSEDLRALYDYNNLDGLFERAPLFSLPPTESDEFITFSEWADIWQAIKAGG